MSNLISIINGITSSKFIAYLRMQGSNDLADTLKMEHELLFSSSADHLSFITKEEFKREKERTKRLKIRYTYPLSVHREEVRDLLEEYDLKLISCGQYLGLVNPKSFEENPYFKITNQTMSNDRMHILSTRDGIIDMIEGRESDQPIIILYNVNFICNDDWYDIIGIHGSTACLPKNVKIKALLQSDKHRPEKLVIFLLVILSFFGGLMNGWTFFLVPLLATITTFLLSILVMYRNLDIEDPNMIPKNRLPWWFICFG